MAEANVSDHLGPSAFVVGGLSFIPLIGVVFGLVAIIWAASTRRQGRAKLALIGTGGIALTFLLYGGLFYFGFVKHGGVYDRLRGGLAQTELDRLVESIEFYKLQNGRYPGSLEALKASMPGQRPGLIYDPSFDHFGEPRRLFFYKLVNEEHYYLRGVGPDGIPFTRDYLLPQITPKAGSHIGLLTEPQPDTAAGQGPH